MKPKHILYAAIGCAAGILLYRGIPLLRYWTKLNRRPF